MSPTAAHPIGEPALFIGQWVRTAQEDGVCGKASAWPWLITIFVQQGQHSRTITVDSIPQKNLLPSKSRQQH